MLILGLDTATRCGGVALIDGETLKGLVVLNVKKTHSERLLRDADFLLAECGAELSGLDAVAVSRGPGSFTGVRIGMACAKGLAFAAKKPLVGVSTLTALALRAGEPGILICPVLDARRGEIFGATYEMNGDRELAETLPGRAEPLKDFLGRIQGRALFCGNGALKFRGEISDALGDRAAFAHPGKCFPSPVEVAFLAKKRLEAGDSDDPETLAPLYLRDHDAAVKRG